MYTERNRITAVLSANFQNDLTTEIDGLNERDFPKFEFKMCFGRISYIVTAPWLCMFGDVKKRVSQIRASLAARHEISGI